MIEVVYSSCTLPNCLGQRYNGAFVSLDYGLLAACLTLAAVILRIYVDIAAVVLADHVDWCLVFVP